jgi:hypothetical protein
MKINGKELKLSPRKTADFYVLVETAKNDEGLPDFLYRAQVISDSFKATYINMTAGIDGLNFFKRYKKLKAAQDYKMFYDGQLKFKRTSISSSQYIINFLSTQEIIKYSDEVLQLDGLSDKKKVVENP